jgi:amino acid permease
MTTICSNDIRSSLLKRSLSPLTTGGIRQSMFTLISAAIGGGILCLPYVFSIVGLIPGLIILSASGILAYVSMLMLLLSAERARIYSYGRLFAKSVDWVYAGPFLDVVAIMFGQGVIVAYFVFLGDFLPPLFDAIGNPLSRTSCILLCCALAIPLVFPSKLSALKYVTPISTLSLVVTAGVVVYRAPMMNSKLDNDMAKTDLVIISPSLLKALSIAVSSFICHTNVVSVAGELVEPSPRRARKISSRAALVQLILYLVIGVSGYFSFSRGTQQNFLNGYPDGDVLVCICRLLLSITIFCGLPMNINPSARACINLYVFLSHFQVDEPLLPATPSEKADHHRTLRIAVGFIDLIIGAVVALSVPGIADVIGVLGGSLGTLIMLVFPALIYARVFRSEMSLFRNLFMVTLLLTSAAVCFASVGLSIVK